MALCGSWARGSGSTSRHPCRGVRVPCLTQLSTRSASPQPTVLRRGRLDDPPVDGSRALQVIGCREDLGLQQQVARQSGASATSAATDCLALRSSGGGRGGLPCAPLPSIP